MTTLRTGQTTDFSNQGTEYSVSFQSTDGAEINGTAYTPNFKKWHGYYRKIAEGRAVINKFASWTFGRAIKADAKNQAKLDKIKGFGKDTARGVLKNQWKVAMICGDSFAHEVRDSQGRLTNLKPLNPDKIAIIANSEGIVVGYAQQGREELYGPEEIFHLSYERTADEIHGIPFFESLEDMILARNEGLGDLRELYHKNVFPTDIYEAETDDTTKLTAITATLNNAFKKREHIVIPAGVFKEIKKVSVAQYSTLDSLPYIRFLIRNFVTACGMPEVVMGWGAETTEASSKIIIVAYEQEIWDMKLYNEEQAKEQLGIEFKIESAPSIMDELQKDNQKDKGQVKELNVNPKKDG